MESLLGKVDYHPFEGAKVRIFYEISWYNRSNFAVRKSHNYLNEYDLVEYFTHLYVIIAVISER